MTDIALNRRTREWQHDRVKWSWITCSREEAVALERDAIGQLDPVLNIAEMSTYPPPLMRSRRNACLRASGCGT